MHHLRVAFQGPPGPGEKNCRVVVAVSMVLQPGLEGVLTLLVQVQMEVLVK